MWHFLSSDFKVRILRLKSGFCEKSQNSDIEIRILEFWDEKKNSEINIWKRIRVPCEIFFWVVILTSEFMNSENEDNILEFWD